jgi:hypothetical protein
VFFSDDSSVFSRFGNPDVSDALAKFRDLADRIQSDPDLQHLLLAFLLGFAFGCFVTALIRTKDVRGRGNSRPDRLAREYDYLASNAERKRRRNEYRTRDGRTIDEVERDARRRL